jgi:hypothetical protein
VLIWIIDYYGINWWNSCLCCDAMFGYVNWWYEMLLLMNWDEFMIGCCCCCCEVLLLMIETLGNHNLWVGYEFVLFLKVFMKMGQMMIFVKRMFWDKFYMILSVFSCLEMFKQTLGSNLSFGKSKLGFLGEKMGFSRNRTVPTRHSELEASRRGSLWAYSLGRAAQWQHPLFRVLESFSHVSVLNWLSV